MAGSFLNTFKRHFVHVNRIVNTFMALKQFPGLVEDYDEVVFTPYTTVRIFGTTSTLIFSCFVDRSRLPNIKRHKLA